MGSDDAEGPPIVTLFVTSARAASPEAPIPIAFASVNRQVPAGWETASDWSGFIRLTVSASIRDSESGKVAP